MEHWAQKYVGEIWTKSCDCGYWFCRVQKEVFGRDLPDVFVGYKGVRNAARILNSEEVQELSRAVKTEDPKDGDAVFLTQRKRPHHIGIVAWIDGRIKILHAIETTGVILTDLLSLRSNGWQVAGYWTWK